MCLKSFWKVVDFIRFTEHLKYERLEYLLSWFVSNIFLVPIRLSSEFWAKQAQRDVAKIKNSDFSYWAWSTPWGHVLTLISFCWNPVLSWAIRYSVFQPVKFTNSLSSCAAVCFQFFDICWWSLDTLNDFKAISSTGFFRFG